MRVRRWTLLAARCAGAGQDAAHPLVGRCVHADLQPHPVHARPHALRHPRHRGDRGGREHGQAADPLHPWAGVRQHHLGRRDQPHAARGDEGVSGDGGRHALRVGAAVIRVGHREPDRAGRHAPTARSAVGPVLVQCGDPVSVGRGRAADPGADDHGERCPRDAGGHGRGARGCALARA